MLPEKICYLESQKKSDQKFSILFWPQETHNLRGEFEQAVVKFKSNPRIFELLMKYAEI